jgi:hypothetical protein
VIKHCALHASLDRTLFYRRRASVEFSSLSLMGRYRRRYNLEMDARYRDLDLSSTVGESERHDL